MREHACQHNIYFNLLLGPTILLFCHELTIIMDIGCLIKILQVSTDHKIFQYGGTSSPLTIIISVYKGLLQLIALILAFHTQNIKVKGLDNAKFIISTVYITTICIVVILLAGTTVRGYLNTFTAITTLALFFLTTVTLSMIFIPKVN